MHIDDIITEANPPRLYFFGVWGAGGAGHYLRTPEGRDVPHGRAGLPWAVHEFDGGLTWNAGEWIVSGSVHCDPLPTTTPTPQGR